MKQLIIFLFFCNAIYSQYDVPLTLHQQFNGKYDYVIIGNTHNEFDNWQQPSPPCQMITQSSASLSLSSNQTVVAAYLYWSGIGNGNMLTYPTLNNVSMIPDTSYVIDINPPIAPLLYFTNFKNITSFVQTNGNNNYTFSNLDLNSLLPDYCSNNIYYSGWNIIIIYEDLTLSNKQLNIYNGLRYVGYDNINNINLVIDNLNVVDNQNAKMTYISWNGSSNNFFNESILFNGNILSNSLNPPNNPFNGTNTFTGSVTNWNQDIDTFDISTLINIGDTQAQIDINSILIRTIQTIVTSIRSELSDATVQINQVSGQGVCGNRNLVVDYMVSNTNSNAVLPANVNVSLYADNTFLQTVVTPTPIAVGGSLNLQTTVNIPLSIPDNFTLKIIVDNTSSNLSQIAESNEANNEDDLAISLTPTTLTIPTFTQVNPICAGQTLNILPTISNNGISGSWSPSLNNLATTTYTFTPNAGQCATTATMTIVVNQNTIPTFTQVSPICAGQTLNILPTTSNNGISGSWSPSINNLTTTTYTFTPNTGQCATTATMTIVVNQNSVPDFADVTICSNETGFVLDNQSPNGILGSWSPSTIDFTNSGTYTFSPNNQCSSSQTITVTVVQNVFLDFEYTISNSLLDTATITITTNSSGNFLYQLDNNTPQSNPIFENVFAGSHTLSVYNQNVCENSVSKTIFIVSYPKFFTPNNDGYNDVWTIQESDYFKIKSLNIFDRFGKLIKVINSASKEWNGTYNGQNIRADDYWFTLTYIENGIERTFKSHFSLKR